MPKQKDIEQPTPQDFIDAGFNVLDSNVSENPLLEFLRTHYPKVIKDGEVNLVELKNAIGVPIDEKVNGYGLNFIGRNVARAKYTQETRKVLTLDEEQSKNADTTGNFIFRGDNLDCLKILKHHYRGRIKVIYIDPPYNTDSDEFVYPDKFDKEEAEVLGLANLSEMDMERLEFSFGNKKSHNGWLSFMYPRLCLARDLLAKDGVIFISIDDNEQANLKLLCDEIFGESNFINKVIWVRTRSGKTVTRQLLVNSEYLLIYAKSPNFTWNPVHKPLAETTVKMYSKNDNDGRGKYRLYPMQKTSSPGPETTYDYIDNNGKVWKCPDKGWRMIQAKVKALENDGRLYLENDTLSEKAYWNERDAEGRLADTLWDDMPENSIGTSEISDLFGGTVVFTNPKPVEYIKRSLLITDSPEKDSIVLDFFAGSGTTAHAVMQLNADDGGNRKFILCQIDEPILVKKNPTAYQFCKDNKFAPVISSITLERVNRAGEQIKEQVKLVGNGLDIGYKVFELADSPHLAMLDGEQLSIVDNPKLTPQDRIRNLIFEIGVDDPAVAPEEIVKNCMYRCGKNYYVTHSVKLDNKENRMALKEAILTGNNVFVDGWTATLNTAMMDYKDRNVLKIVFFGFSRKR